MKKVKKIKRFISFILVLCMLESLVPAEFLAAENSPSASSAAEEGSESSGVFDSVLSGDNTTNYYEVKFELPEGFEWAVEMQEKNKAEEEQESSEDSEDDSDDADAEDSEDDDADAEDSEGTEAEDQSESEEKMVDIPETMLLKKGTLISTIKEPKVTGFVFLGWYYDKDLQLKTASNDIVDHNMTLYAKMGPVEDEIGDLNLNYVSEQNVEVSHPILLASYGLTEEEIREKISVRDTMSLDETTEDYVLTLQDEPDLDLLIEDEEQRQKVQDILDDYLSDDPDSEEEENPEDTDAEAPESTEAENAEENEEAENADVPEAEDTEEPSAARPDSAKTGGWETPDGSRYIEDPGNKYLAEQLLDADVPKNLTKKLTEYYAPQEAEEVDNIILWGVLGILGITSEESLDAALGNLIDAYKDREALASYLKEILAPEPSENENEAENAAADEEQNTAEEDRSADDIENTAPDEEEPEDDIAWLRMKMLQIVRESEEILPDVYAVTGGDGGWKQGTTIQTEILDNENLRFVKDGEIIRPEITFYNIVIEKKEYNNMSLGSWVVDIPVSECEGIDFQNGSLFSFNMNQSSSMDAARNEKSGTFIYNGDQELTEGTVCCIHEEGWDFERSVGATGEECPITYVKITEVLGGREYAYVMPEVEELIFTPDMFPLKDDGNFNDGEILVTPEDLDFSGPEFSEFGLEDAVMEPGDLVTLVSVDEENEENNEIAGYGRITDVRPEGNNFRISYDIIQENEIAEAGGYSLYEENIPLSLTDEEIQELSQSIMDDLENNDAIEQMEDNISALINAEAYDFENPEYADLMKDIRFETDDGKDMSLEEVQALNGSFEWDGDLKGHTQLAFFCKHFNGSGLRFVFNWTRKGHINLSEKGKLEVNLKAQIEIEIGFGVSADCYVDWKTVDVWLCKVKFPMGWKVYCSLYSGVFFGAGFNVTIQTKKRSNEEANAEENEIGEEDDDSIIAEDGEENNNENENNNSLSDDRSNRILGDDEVKAQNKARKQAENVRKWENRLDNLKGFFDNVNKIENYATEGFVTEDGENVSADSKEYGTGASVGINNITDERYKYYSKYANFVNSDPPYVPLFNKSLLGGPKTIYHCGVFEVTIDIKFVLSLKVNVLIGCSIEFGCAKQYGITLQIPTLESKATEMDMEVPNFNMDLSVFGIIGIKPSIDVDFRLGLISAKTNSVGLIFSIGLPVTFYGFFYASYGWKMGEGWKGDIAGSMLITIDLSTSAKLLAQMGEGKYSYDHLIADFTMPLLSIGAENIFCDMAQVDEEKLNLEVPPDKEYVEMKSDVLNVMAMSMIHAKTIPLKMDSKIAVEGNHQSVKSLGGTFTQKDEEFFDVSIVDTDKDGKSLGHAEASWLYDPVDNRIYPKPHTKEDTELWGEITFTFHGPDAGGVYTQREDSFRAMLNYGMGFGINKYDISRKVKVHWKGETVPVKAEIYKQKKDAEAVENISELTGDKAKKIDSMYEKTGEVELGKTFNGLLLTVDGKNDAFNQGNKYKLAFIGEKYNDQVAEEYKNVSSSDAAAKTRNEIFKNTGYLWMLPEDKEHSFIASSENKIKLYFNGISYFSHWIMLDAETENQMDTDMQNQKIGLDDKIMESVPKEIKDEIPASDTNYSYSYYMITEAKMPKTVISRLNQKMKLNNYPSILPGRSQWTEITKDTVMPKENVYIFVERKPNKKQITWKYEDGDRLTFLKPGEKIVPPYEGAKEGYDLLYWADENGQQYENMPDRDLVLYPHYEAKKHTVTWDYNGERKTTEVKTGENILKACPFEKPTDPNKELVWRNGSPYGDDIVEEDVMPDRNLVLFGVELNYRTVTWKSGDSVVKTTREVVGEVLELLDMDLAEGMTIRWLKDGSILPEGYVMPDEDITLTAHIYRKDHAHDWQPVGTWEKPTCITGSVRHVKCSVCLEEKDEDLPPDMDAHLWGDPTYSWNEENDICYATHVCKRETSHTETIAAKTESKVTKEPTCAEEGELTLTAVFEDPAFETQTKTKKIEKTEEHTPGRAVRENVVNPTCAQAGSYDEVTYCSVCGTEISRRERALNRRAHTPGSPVTENYTEGICDTGGTYDRVIYCTVCGEELSREKVTQEAPGHIPGAPVRERVQYATCTEAGGYDEVIYCTVCREKLSEERRIIPAPGHTRGSAVREKYKEPTCTEAGRYEEVIYCTVCYEELSRTPKTVRALGHTNGNPVREKYKEPTCTEAGRYEEVIYCRICNEELSRTPKTVRALGHTEGDPVQENYVDPTCTVDGSYDEVKYCTVCEEQISRIKRIIPKTGHTPGQAVNEKILPATCTEEGSMDVVVYCEVCKEAVKRDQVVLPKIPHTPGDPVKENIFPGTCMEKGHYEEVKYCTVCSSEIENSRRIVYNDNFGDHVPGEQKRQNEIPPTCTEDGSYELITRCTLCEEIIDLEGPFNIPASGHKYGPVTNIETVVEPDCVSNGKRFGKKQCEVCGKYSYVYEAIPRLGHEIDYAVYHADPPDDIIDETGIRRYEVHAVQPEFAICNICDYYWFMRYIEGYFTYDADPDSDYYYSLNLLILSDEYISSALAENPDIKVSDLINVNTLQFRDPVFGENMNGKEYVFDDSLYDEKLADHKGDTLVINGLVMHAPGGNTDNFEQPYFDTVGFSIQFTIPERIPEVTGSSVLIMEDPDIYPAELDAGMEDSELEVDTSDLITEDPELQVGTSDLITEDPELQVDTSDLFTNEDPELEVDASDLYIDDPNNIAGDGELIVPETADTGEQVVQ